MRQTATKIVLLLGFFSAPTYLPTSHVAHLGISNWFGNVAYAEPGQNDDGGDPLQPLMDATPDTLPDTFKGLSPQQQARVIQAIQGRLQGGGGANGGGGTSGIAQLAFGVAAIIAATQPALSAAVQSAADQAVAKINAGAQTKMTDTVGKTVVKQGEIQMKELADNNQTAKDLNTIEKKGSLETLGMELKAEKEARQDLLKLDKQELAQKEKFESAEINIAQQSANATMAQTMQHYRVLSGVLANLMPKANQATLSVTRSGGSSSVDRVQRLIANAAREKPEVRGHSASMLSVLRGSTRYVRHRAARSDDASTLVVRRATYSKRVTLAPIPQEATEPQYAIRTRGVAVRHGESFTIDAEGAAQASAQSSSSDE